MLKIHELIDDRGELRGVYLRVTQSEGSPLELITPELTVPLTGEVLRRVFARYGAPFDPEARVTVVDELALGSGSSVRHVLHLAGYDVVPRDYVVLDDGQGEVLCVHGAAVVGPLLHLGRALAARAQS
jgi:hypothetical protein